MAGSDVAVILGAVRFAAERHRRQRRKGLDADPYVNHPIEVAHELAAAGVLDPDVLVAALLHDTVEDTGTGPGEIEERFGPAVRAIVLEVTDDKTLPREVRRRLQVERAATLGPGARLVRLGDKISNVREVGERPPAGWTAERRRSYLDWAEEVVARLRGTSPALERRFDEELARARAR